MIFLLTVCLVSINSYSAEGAFSLLNVEARDVDKYVEVLKNNTQIFEALGSVQAGVCIPEMEVSTMVKCLFTTPITI